MSVGQPESCLSFSQNEEERLTGPTVLFANGSLTEKRAGLGIINTNKIFGGQPKAFLLEMPMSFPKHLAHLLT